MRGSAVCAIVLLAVAVVLGAWTDGVAGDSAGGTPLLVAGVGEGASGSGRFEASDERSGWYWGQFRLFPGWGDIFNRKVYAATVSFAVPGIGQFTNGSGDVGKGITYVAGNMASNAVFSSTDEKEEGEDEDTGLRILMSPTNVLLNRIFFEPKETATEVLLLSLGLAVAGSSAYDAYQRGTIAGRGHRVQVLPAARGTGLALHIGL